MSAIQDLVTAANTLSASVDNAVAKITGGASDSAIAAVTDQLVGFASKLDNAVNPTPQ